MFFPGKWGAFIRGGAFKRSSSIYVLLHSLFFLILGEILRGDRIVNTQYKVKKKIMKNLSKLIKGYLLYQYMKDITIHLNKINIFTICFA